MVDAAEYQVVVPHLSSLADKLRIDFGRSDLSIPVKAILKMAVVKRP